MKRLKIDKTYLVFLFLSIFLSLVIGGILMILTGHSPVEGYGSMIQGAFGNERLIGNTIAKAMQLCLTGLAMVVAARAGMFNVGGEGQLYAGAMTSAMIGIAMTGLPKPVVILVAILASVIIGGFFAYIPAILKVKFKVSEVITTIMFNSAIIYLCNYLVKGPFQSTEKGIYSATDNVFAYQLTKLLGTSSLTTSFFLGCFIAFVCWYVLGRTSIGLEMKVTGENERFSFFSGIKKEKLMIMSMIASGAICGLVGMFEVYGVHGRYIISLSKEFYFDGMLLAMIMNYNPVGIMLISIFFAILKVGSTYMELTTGVSSQISQIIFAIIIFFMASQHGISAWYLNRKAKKAALKLSGEVK